MINLYSLAIVTEIKMVQENAFLLRCFSKDYGLLSGFYRPLGESPSIGAIGQVHWLSRVEGHLGKIIWEQIDSILGRILHKAERLAMMQQMIELLQLFLIERDPHPQLFSHAHNLLQQLIYNPDWMQVLILYCRLELLLLEELGFGLDFSGCPMLGSKEDLSYVSPKSGRAVSLCAGKPYANRLLPLPAFLLTTEMVAKPEDIQHALRLTRFFLLQAADQLGKQSENSALFSAYGLKNITWANL